MDCNSIIKSSNGITSVSVEARLLKSRKLFIEGEITPELACNVIRKIMVLTLEDNEKCIDILINSWGGEIGAGLLIYDVLQSCKTPIRMFCLGEAYSMAAVLFACGFHGRYMLSHSKLMLHEPLLGNRVSGNSSSIKSISDSLLETEKMMNQILAKHTGKTEQEIKDACSYDHYFSAEESIKFGLCDKIVGFDVLMEG